MAKKVEAKKTAVKKMEKVTPRKPSPIVKREKVDDDDEMDDAVDAEDEMEDEEETGEVVPETPNALHIPDTDPSAGEMKEAVAPPPETLNPTPQLDGRAKPDA